MRRQGDNREVPSPVFIYSTRSSTRRSLNVKTDEVSDQVSTYTSTPTSLATDRSMDLQASPSSSRTSHSVIEPVSTPKIPFLHFKMPPKTKKNQTPRAKTDLGPDPSIETTITEQQRPGRTRKPTQKAAELAANIGSKLYKSVHSRQSANEHGNEYPQPPSENLECDFAGEERENSLDVRVIRKRKSEASMKPADNISSSRHTRRVFKETEAPRETPKASISSPLKRRYPGEPDNIDSSSAKKARITRTVITGYQSETPVVETAAVATDPAPAPATEITRKRGRPAKKSGVLPEKPQKAPLEAQKLSKGSPTHLPPPKSVRKKRQIREASPPSSEDKFRSESPPPPPTPPLHNPTSLKIKIKVKPLVPCVDSALEGVTGLPCGLVCLNDESMIYAMASFVVEYEELAEKIAVWKDFERDFSPEACLTRCRYNIVMAEFCVCGECDGVRDGGGCGEEVSKRGGSEDDGEVGNDDDDGDENEGRQQKNTKKRKGRRKARKRY